MEIFKKWILQAGILTIVFLVNSIAVYAKTSRCETGHICVSKKNSVGTIDGEESCYDSRKRLRRWTTYKNGAIHGSQVCYSENGMVISSEEFKNDQLDGLSRVWNEEVQKYEECEYKNNHKEGPCTTFQTSRQGKVSKIDGKTITSYKEGQRDGWQVLFDEDGREKKRLCFQAGQLELEHPEKCGSITSTNVVKDEKNEGVKEIRDRKGKLVAIETWKNGQLDGLLKDFNKHEHVVREAHYEKNQLKGWEIQYFDSGATKQKTFWDGPNNIEKSISYYENGKIEYEYTRISQRKNDMDEYSFRQFFDNGQLKLEGKCLVSQLSFESECTKPQGEWTAYKRNGEISLQSNYENGKLHGDVIDHKKRYLITTSYENGVKTKMVLRDKRTDNIVKTEEYYSDGSIKKSSRVSQ